MTRSMHEFDFSEKFQINFSAFGFITNCKMNFQAVTSKKKLFQFFRFLVFQERLIMDEFLSILNFNKILDEFSSFRTVDSSKIIGSGYNNL